MTAPTHPARSLRCTNFGWNYADEKISLQPALVILFGELSDQCLHEHITRECNHHDDEVLS